MRARSSRSSARPAAKLRDELRLQRGRRAQERSGVCRRPQPPMGLDHDIHARSATIPPILISAQLIHENERELIVIDGNRYPIGSIGYDSRMGTDPERVWIPNGSVGWRSPSRCPIPPPDPRVASPDSAFTPPTPLVTPSILNRRSFPPLLTHVMALGARCSPSPAAVALGLGFTMLRSW